jgi:flagellar biosynthesis anti-sigma factor FlgM
VLLSAAAAAAAGDTPRADPARIAALKQAVQAGTYKVDLDKLAGRIVDEEKR